MALTASDRVTVKNYSIVLNGLYDPGKIANVKVARQYADEVVVSSWDGAITASDEAELRSLGVTVVTRPDPGAAHVTYEQAGVRKPFSVNRQVMSARGGLSRVSNEFVIRSRLDARLDYDKLFEIWSGSGRRLGSVNLTSVCPHRVLSYPYLFTVSDWCHVGRTRDLIDGYFSSEIVEADLVRQTPLTCGDMTWRSRLAVEQVITLLLSGSDEIYRTEIKQRLSDYTSDEWAEHRRVLAQFANVRLQDVGFRTDKYRFLSGRWLAWDHIHFRDDGPFKANIVELALLIAARIRPLLRGSAR